MRDTVTRRAALFVDFDNIFLGLQRLDRAAAEAFATEPEAWLDAIARGDGRERRFLIRNCYLNPAAFSKYRSYWVRAGFGVVDCPSLTQQGKSSADINLVLDVVDVLGGATRVDEFFIASADADFTSLVRKLRAEDRWTSVIVAGPVASAYRAVADQVVQADDLIELITSRAVSAAAGTSEDRMRSDGRDAVLAHLRSAKGPVELATLAHRARLADPTLTRDWGESGSFRSWLAASGAAIGIHSGAGGWAWDAERFREEDLPFAQDAPRPEPVIVPTEVGASIVGDLTPLQHQVTQVTDIPRLTEDAYRRVLTALHADLAEHPLVLNDTSKRVRDACASAGTPVGRGSISFVIRGLQYSDLGVSRQPTLREVASGWTRNVESLCRGARIELDDRDLAELRAWVSGGLLEDVV
ncbi:NYN domain-containing protein [Agromyces sp. CF514]|uniref:NYN domain-containing protein n=1 Tax=Agromyces sp. CF514 TaxID=1881031 RepID=UPI0008E163C5|nr:NYN domain-containing protein [Agromyces sp. CF514]SFR68498.1 NYN domain-containing protein [Agromyces sp. CF514]